MTDEETMKDEAAEEQTPAAPPPWYKKDDWLTATVELGGWGEATLKDPPPNMLTIWKKNAIKAARLEGEEADEIATGLAYTATHLAPFVKELTGPDGAIKVGNAEHWENTVLPAIPQKVASRLTEAVNFFFNDDGLDSGNDS